MANRQHQQTEHTTVLIKGKNNSKEVHRQMAYFRVIKILYGLQNSSNPTKLTHTERMEFWMANICLLI